MHVVQKVFMYVSKLFGGGGGGCKGGQNQNWLPNPCLLWGHKWAEMLHHPCILGDPQTKGTKSKHNNLDISLIYLCTGVVLIFGPIWCSSIIGFS